MNPSGEHAPADDLRARSVVIDALSASLDRGKNGLDSVPGLLRQILEAEKWRHFVTLRGEFVRHDSFPDFVRTPPLKGLGATEDLLRRMVADDVATLNLLDAALKRAPGRPPASAPGGPAPTSPTHSAQRSTDGTDAREETVPNVHSSSPRPAGNRRDRAVRQLREQRPDLLRRVEAGEIPSLHAAMVEAGFRDRTLTVPVSSPEKIAKALRRTLTDSDLHVLADLLTRDGADGG